MNSTESTQHLGLSPAAYLKSKQTLWYRVTFLLSTLTLFSVFFIEEGTYPLSIVRNVLGIIFILLLPGYVFLKALFPAHIPEKEKFENLSRTEQVSLSIIMSFAIDALMGLLLNFSLGISLIPIVLSILAFVFVFATVAILRDYIVYKEKVAQGKN